MNRKQLIVCFCFVAVFAIAIHHFWVCGRLFDVGDMLHHEWFAAAFCAFGVGFALGDVME